MANRAEIDGCWRLLHDAVRDLSLSPAAQVEAKDIGVTSDELASDFDHAYEVARRYALVDASGLGARLARIHDALALLTEDAFVDGEALDVDPRWAQLRGLARAALDEPGWPTQP